MSSVRSGSPSCWSPPSSLAQAFSLRLPELVLLLGGLGGAALCGVLPPLWCPLAWLLLALGSSAGGTSPSYTRCDGRSMWLWCETSVPSGITVVVHAATSPG